MQKKLTITIDEQVCEGLYEVVGRWQISQFIEDVVPPHVVARDAGLISNLYSPAYRSGTNFYSPQGGSP